MYNYRAKVTRVVDGDTIDLEVDMGLDITCHIRGRLTGVDTPERGEDDWFTATDMLTSLLNAAQDADGYIKISTEKTGKYGRWLVNVEGVNKALADIWPYGKKKRTNDWWSGWWAIDNIETIDHRDSIE
tara:strand:+ start:769 stop:1155 length:387 start_codon:yes stop_codon:yes gene_type:complete